MAHELLQSFGVGAPLDTFTPRLSSSDVIASALQQAIPGIAPDLHQVVPRKLSGSLCVGPFPVISSPRISSPRGSVASSNIVPSIVANSPGISTRRISVASSNPSICIHETPGSNAMTRSQRLSVPFSNSLPCVTLATPQLVQLEPRRSLVSAQQLASTISVSNGFGSPRCNSPEVWKNQEAAFDVQHSGSSADPRELCASIGKPPKVEADVPCTSQICDVSDAIKASEAVTTVGCIQSVFRSTLGGGLSRPHSPSTSPILVGSSDRVLDRSVDASEVCSPQSGATPSQLDLSVVRDIPNKQQEPPGSPTSPNTEWARACLKPRKNWKPAITTPTYFFRHDERCKASGLSINDSPPSSACSTPRRGAKCYEDLYADAAKRHRRQKERKEALEADNDSKLQTSRESSLRATRRYKSNDTRNVLQRTEDHLRKREELEKLANHVKKMKEQQELEECTFKPSLSQPKRPSRSLSREQDERHLERHLRQLAHKQLDVKARLCQMESQWIKVHSQRNELFAQRCNLRRNEKGNEVLELLRTREGQDYYWDRVRRMVESSSATNIDAQSAVLSELLEQQRQLIQEQVGLEVDKELELPDRDLEFWTRRNVLLESLEAIESRASPTLQLLARMPDAFAIMKASSFHEGLAKQMRDHPPDPDQDREASTGNMDPWSMAALKHHMYDAMRDSTGTAAIGGGFSRPLTPQPMVSRTLSGAIGTSSGLVSTVSETQTQKVIVPHTMLLTPTPSARIVRHSSSGPTVTRTSTERDSIAPSELLQCAPYPYE